MITFAELQTTVGDYATEESMAPERAFIFYVLGELVDLSKEEARRCVIDGPYDGGIDVIYANDETSQVILLQSKFSQNLETDVLTSGMRDLVRGVRYIFGEQNQRAGRLDEAARKFGLPGLLSRSDLLLQVIFLTSVKVGSTKQDRQQLERDTRKNLEKFLKNRNPAMKATFEILDLRALSEFLGEIPGIDSVRVTTKPGELFKKPDSSAVVFTVDGSTIAGWVEQYGEDLFENNVRRFLGFRGNVNKGIRKTIESEQERALFWYFNNGIAGICSSFSIENDELILRNFSIINGAQTANIMQDVRTEKFTIDGAEVLMKVINIEQIPEQDKVDLIAQITLAANSQNPTNTRDLRSVDKIQKMLEQRFRALGYTYIRRRGVRARKTAATIQMKEMAQAYTAFFLMKPNVAYARVNEIFGDNETYEQVFPKNLLDAADLELKSRTADYLISYKLLSLIRNDIGNTDLPYELTYHVLAALRERLSDDKLAEFRNLPTPQLDGAVEQWLNSKKELIMKSAHLALANLTTQGFELPRDAKSQVGYQKFKESFEANYRTLSKYG